MKRFIVSRYFLKQWWKIFFKVFVIFATILCIATIIDGASRRTATIAESFINLGFEFPIWLKKLMPFVTTYTSLWFLRKLRDSKELVAAQSLGLTKMKLRFIVFLATTPLFIGAFYSNNFLLPILTKEKADWIQKTGARFSAKKWQRLTTLNKNSGQFWLKTSDEVLSFDEYNEANQTVSNINIYRYQNKRLDQIISADRGRYENGGPLILSNGKQITALSKKDFPKTTHFEEFQINNLSPELFNSSVQEIFFLSFWDLLNFLFRTKNGSVRTRMKYIIYLGDNILLAFLTFLFSQVPLLISLSPNTRKNDLLGHIFFTTVFCFGFYFLYDFSLSYLNHKL